MDAHSGRPFSRLTIVDFGADDTIARLGFGCLLAAMISESMLHPFQVIIELQITRNGKFPFWRRCLNAVGIRLNYSTCITFIFGTT